MLSRRLFLAFPLAASWRGLSQVTIPTTDSLGEVAYGGCTSDSVTAILILVHSFSGVASEITVEPAKSALLSIPDAALVCPQLFGVAGNPNTCGSPVQLEHLNDVINWMQARYGKLPVFLVGVSGGAGLGATFVGAYPSVVRGASFWSGYHDLGQWHDESVIAKTVYWQLMEKTLGPPAAVYRAQSPSGVARGTRNCTIFINNPLGDVDILPHHRQDYLDQLMSLPPSANVTVNYISYPDMPHGIDYQTVLAQIAAMRA